MSNNRTIRKMAVVFLSILLVLAMAQTALAKSGKWKQDGSLYWFEYDDGGYPANVIITIRGEQYAFDANGYMVANNWVHAPGYGWHYCTGSGAIATNQWVGNYYVGSDGVMLTNTWTPDGYWVDEDGEWDPSVPRQGSGSVRIGSSGRKGSGSITSSAQPRIVPLRIASARSAVLTTAPRAQLTMTAFGFIAESVSRLMRLVVLGVTGTCSVTISLVRSSSSCVR